MLDECMKYEEGDTEILPMYSDKKTAPVPIRPTTSPTYTVRRLNMGLRDDRQATNRLNNEMDKHGDNIQQTHNVIFHRCGSLMSNQR